MNFTEYLNKAWSLHTVDAKRVAEEFKDNFSLMTAEDDVMAMSLLIVHVCGEHLGEWERGIDLLRKIKNNATIKDKSAMNRYMGILNLGNNPNLTLENYSDSDQARIYASTAVALCRLGGIKNAERFIKTANEIVNDKLNKEDEAYTDLMSSIKQIVTHLEGKREKSQKEIDFLNLVENLH